MGFLTTHILDTAQGKPAHGIQIQLYSTDKQRKLIKTLISNADGRTDEQLLSESEFQAGTWELVFRVADYFSNAGLETDQPPFLDEITLRFNTSRDDHYHVPLLVSPWSYSTYRGS